MTLSFEEPKRQRPRILKGPTVSSDVFVLSVAEAAGPLFHGVLNGDARPFIPAQLTAGDLVDTGLFSETRHGADGEPESAVVLLPPPPPPDPSPEILAAANAQAAEILAAADARAAQIVHQARTDAASYLDEAKQQTTAWEHAAYAEGYRVSMAAARADLSTQLHQAAAMLDGAQSAKAQALSEVEPEAIRLILAIARKVIHREIGGDHRVVIETVRESLQRLGGRAVARVRVHPLELAALNDAWHDLTKGAKELEFFPDERITPGGCIVESRQGEIDAQIETQIEAVTAEFLDTADRETPVSEPVTQSGPV